MAQENENRLHASLSLNFAVQPTPSDPPSGQEIVASSGIVTGDFVRLAPGLYLCTLNEGISDAELAITVMVGFTDEDPSELATNVWVLRPEPFGLTEPNLRGFVIAIGRIDPVGQTILNVDASCSINWWRIAEPTPGIPVEDLIP